LPVPYGTTTITSPAAERRRLEKLKEQEKAKEKEKDSGPPVLGP
jgi:hypothetical protein